MAMYAIPRPVSYTHLDVYKRQVQDSVRAGVLAQVKLKEDEFERTFRIIYHKKKFRTQASEEFLRFLKSDDIQGLLEDN